MAKSKKDDWLSDKELEEAAKWLKSPAGRKAYGHIKVAGSFGRSFKGKKKRRNPYVSKMAASGIAVPYEGKRLTFSQLIKKLGVVKAHAAFWKAKTFFDLKNNKVLRRESARRRMDLLKKSSTMDMHGRTVFVAPTKKLKIKGRCADCGQKARVNVTEKDGASWLWCGSCDIGGNPARKKQRRYRKFWKYSGRGGKQKIVQGIRVLRRCKKTNPKAKCPRRKASRRTLAAMAWTSFLMSQARDIAKLCDKHGAKKAAMIWRQSRRRKSTRARRRRK
jgi:hypothetical protein